MPWVCDDRRFLQQRPGYASPIATKAPRWLITGWLGLAVAMLLILAAPVGAEDIGVAGQPFVAVSKPADQAVHEPDPTVFDPDGNIEGAPLLLADDVALGLRYTAPSERHHHDQWSYRVYVTNLARDAEGKPFPIGRCGPDGHELLLQRDYSLILFNLVTVVEWDASPMYLQDLEQAFRSASDYLYDLTDGQIAIGKVVIVDDEHETNDSDTWWHHADVRVNPSNTVCPAHLPPDVVSQRDAISLPPFWTRRGTSPGAWSGQDGYRTLIHELGHHVLGLYDEYVSGQTYCTDGVRLPNEPPDDTTSASAMAWQFTATEFSAPPPAGRGICPVSRWDLWSEGCETTPHFKKTGMSVWETIDLRFSDQSVPRRWEIITPTERGSVTPGPDAVPTAFPWPQIQVMPYVAPLCQGDETTCAPLHRVCVADGPKACKSPANTNVTLKRPMGSRSSITLGKLDGDYCIEVVEGRPGSQLLITCDEGNSSQQVTLVITHSTPATSTVYFSEIGPALTEHLPAPPQIGFSSQDSSIQPWAADFLDSVQAASSICPSLAPDLFESLQDLAAAPELTMALLDQQAMAQVEPALPAGPAWSQAAMEGFSGQWPRQDVLWWQRPMPSGEEDAAWQRLHRGLPMLQQAFQRQASTTCQVIEPETESYLFTPDGLWLAQVPPQQQIIEVALQSWLFGPDETFFGTPSVGQSFRLSASRAFAEPILVSYTANCGPGGGSSSLVVVNTQTGEVVKPTLSPDGFQLVFRITEAGTYRLASTAGW